MSIKFEVFEVLIGIFGVVISGNLSEGSKTSFFFLTFYHLKNYWNRDYDPVSLSKVRRMRIFIANSNFVGLKTTDSSDKKKT